MFIHWKPWSKENYNYKKTFFFFVVSSVFQGKHAEQWFQTILGKTCNRHLVRRNNIT